LPTSFQELGAKEEDIPKMAAKVGLTGGRKLGSFQPLDTQDIENIYKLCIKK
jgi:hypothetical protein